jgi:hypothetical protein
MLYACSKVMNVSTCHSLTLWLVFKDGKWKDRLGLMPEITTYKTTYAARIKSPAFYRNPDVEMPARFVMSIGDALPAASTPVALPARTDTITKDKLYYIVNRQLHVAPSPAADYRDPASPYHELTLAQRLPQLPTALIFTERSLPI